jgi:anti-anti-sigma factor
MVVIMVCGEADLLTSPLLRDALLPQLRGPTRRLIVDLTAVGFFGAASLTVLATVRQAALAAGTRLCLIANTRPVLLPLTITGHAHPVRHLPRPGPRATPRGRPRPGGMTS